jgi:glucose 1-dehydrogenase
MRLKDKICIVTGGAQGIGFACAKAFANEGARVVIADIDAEKGDAAARSLGGAGRFRQCDVSDSEQVRALVADTVETEGGLDVMLANAAIIVKGTILDLSEDDFDRVLGINLKGFFLCGQAAAKHMVESGRGGAIINMSSIQAVITNPDLLSYAVCKGGLQQLTKASALALAQKGVRVNAIAPGSINTAMFKQAASNPEIYRTAMSRTPMGRPGEPEEIAKIAVFLASDDSSYVTGETIVADGGRMNLNYVVPVAD